MGEDRHLVGGEVAINAPVLEFALFVPPPATLPRLSETRMVHDDHKRGAWLQQACDFAAGSGQVFDILDGEEAAGPIKRSGGEGGWQACGVADKVGGPLRGEFFCALDQRGGSVHTRQVRGRRSFDEKS